MRTTGWPSKKPILPQGGFSTILGVAPALGWMAIVTGSLLHGAAFASEMQADPRSNAAPTTNQEVITPQEIERQIQQAQAATELDDATRSKIVERFQQALSQMRQTAELDEVAERNRKLTGNVQQRLQETQEKFEELESQPPLPEGDNLAELEQQILRQQERLTSLRQDRDRLEAEPARRANRRKEARMLLVSAPERLEEIQEQLKTPGPADEESLMSTARRWELRARRQLIQRQIPALQSELARYDAEDAVDLVRLQRDLLAQQFEYQERYVKSLSELVQRRRRQEAATLVRRARQQEEETHRLLKGPKAEPDYARENTILAEEIQAVIQRIEEVDAALKDDGQKLQDLRKEIAQTHEKVKSIGLTDLTGQLLREQRVKSVRPIEQYRKNVALRQEKIDSIHFTMLEYDDERSELANLESSIDQLVETARGRSPERLNDEQLQQLRQSARELLEKRRALLDLLIRNYNAYFDKLLQLHNIERQIVSETEQFAKYIDERVLWIRSGKMLGLEELRNGTEALSLLFHPQTWMTIGRALWADLRQNPVIGGFGLCVFSLFVWLGGRFRDELTEIGEQAQKGAFHRYEPTLRATLLTLLLGVTWPGGLLFLSWRLGQSATAHESVSAVAYGLRIVAMIAVLLEVCRQTCRYQGLAESHFDWPVSAVRLLRQNLRLLMLAGLPLVFMTATLHGGQPTTAVERLIFIIGMFVLGAFVHRILQPIGGVFHETIAYNRDGWLDRLKYIGYSIGVSIPLALAVLAFAGYYYTARHLSWQLYASLCLLLLIFFLRALLFRWVVISRRKLSIEQARERRTAQEGSAADEDTSSSTIPPASEPTVDLATTSTQTRRLVQAGLMISCLFGLWLIWLDMFPALSVLDRWPIWHVTVEASQQRTTASGETRFTTVERVEPVTVADFLFAVLAGVFTVLAAQNLPGLLEMSLLSRLPLDASIRYAITSLSSYLIIIIGVIVGFSMIGIGWSKVHWLAAALTVGLGFGLQEVFANFVSGIIILFERPIRIGDIVTVDSVTGVVSRIRMRATTITNWDRKEFIVPNKEFITGRLMNWTLTDAINRVTITVGAAYGSDTRQITKLLQKIAAENPLVLDDPEPIITFEEFGESALIFTMRVYLPDLENRLTCVHALHSAIDDAFRKRGIEIAFPQRDLHIRSVKQWVPDLASDGQQFSTK